MIRKKIDDIIAYNKGPMKWLNIFLRFVLYPLIRPKIFFGSIAAILIITIIIPKYVFNVEFSDMPTWQLEKIKQWSKQTYQYIIPTTKKIYNQPLSFIKSNDKSVQQNKSEDIVDYNIKPQKERIIFDVSIQNTINDSIETPSENSEPNIKNYNEVDIPSVPTKEQQISIDKEIKFTPNKNLNLIYVETPKKITGMMTVINANEVLVDSTEIFLYGIYTPLSSILATKAAAYMVDSYDGKQVDCYIGAYTQENKATAICIHEGKNINKDLVEQKLSQNINLF